jgi:hypothetical protein
MIRLELIDRRLPADRALGADSLDDPMGASDRRSGALQVDAAGIVQEHIGIARALLADRVHVE